MALAIAGGLAAPAAAGEATGFPGSVEVYQVTAVSARDPARMRRRLLPEREFSLPAGRPPRPGSSRWKQFSPAPVRSGKRQPALVFFKSLMQRVLAGLPEMERGAQRRCLALALYHEARGEALEGQVAVAATILNRVASRAYPAHICGVVFQGSRRRTGCQFSFACGRHALTPRNRAVFARMERLAGRILAVVDDSGVVRPGRFGPIARTLRRFAMVTHYHRYDVHPGWSRKLVRVAQSGAHVFFRSPRVIRRMPSRFLLARALSTPRRGSLAYLWL